MSLLDRFISRQSIRTLTSLLIACATIPALLVIFVLGLELKRGQVKDQSMELARVTASYHQNAIRQAQALLETIAKPPVLKDQSAPEISELFQIVVTSNPQYASLSLARPDGSLYASSAGTDSQVNFTDRYGFRAAARTRRFSVGQTSRGLVSSLPVLPFAEPVIDAQGELSGVLLLGLRLDVYERYFSTLEVDEGTRFVLFDRQGIMLFRYPKQDPSPVGEKLSQPIWENIVRSRETRGTFQAKDPTGLPVTYSYIRMGDEKENRSELGILVGVPTPNFFEQIWPAVAWTAFAVGFIAVCAMTIGYFLSNKILITGLVALEGKTSEIIRSNQLIPVQAMPGCREVRALAESFNRLVGFLRLDKKARDKAETALRQSEEKYRSIFETAPVGIYRSTMDGRIITANTTHAHIHGYDSAQEFLSRTAQGTQELYVDISRHGELRRILRENGEVTSFESERIRKDGSLVWVSTTAHLIMDPAFAEPILEGFVLDITKRKRAEAELTRLATTDPLTGAANRRRFFARGAEEFARSQRHGLDLALLMIDIDYFKAINDTFGHKAGDVTLQTMVAKCQEILRVEDLFARLGGEEFAALLVHTDLHGAQLTASRLLKALGDLEVSFGDSLIHFTVSIGVAVLSPGDGSLDDIVSRADEALYQAKNAGRDCVRVAQTG